MDWINEEVVTHIKKGNDALQWVTPSGFTATQQLLCLR